MTQNQEIESKLRTKLGKLQMRRGPNKENIFSRPTVIVTKYLKIGF